MTCLRMVALYWVLIGIYLLMDTQLLGGHHNIAVNAWGFRIVATLALAAALDLVLSEE